MTAYSENREELEQTAQGIQKNIERARQGGIDPSQIAVIYIFDGIDRVNNDQKD